MTAQTSQPYWVSFEKVIVYCFFGPAPRSYIQPEEVLESVNVATGWDLNIDDLLEIAETDPIIAALGPTSNAAPAQPSLFFSEYAEGSSYNKALEIVNYTGAAPIDLGRVITIDKPNTRVYYNLQEIGRPNFDSILDGFGKKHNLF